MSYTPVIPPHPDERQPSVVDPPVIPTLSPHSMPTTPAWMGHPQVQANPSAFPSTPYAGAGLNSYFAPPTGLPPQIATPIPPLGANGISADFTGYPHFAPDGRIMSYQNYPQYIPVQPQAPPPSMSHPTPAMQAMHTTPAMHPGAPPMFQFAAAGGTPWPPQAAAFATPFAQPGMMPGGLMPQAGMMQGMMPPGVIPGVMHTPFPMAHPGLHPAQAAAAQPPPPAASSHRPYRSQDMVDKFDKFADQHYGPVLDAFLAGVVDATMEVNPLLAPPPDGPDERPYLKWNMLWPTGQCQKSTDPPIRSWSVGRHAPATWPRVKSLRLVSRTFPWIISVDASVPEEGVTCGDVMESVHKFMYGRVSKAQMDSASPNQKALIGQSFWHNRSTAPDVPGGRLEHALLRCDWLGLHTMFGGIVEVDPRFRRDILCGTELPCTFELKCLKRYPMTTEELMEQEAREQETQMEERRPRRSRATSRVSSRAPSRPPSRVNPRNPSVHSISSSSSTTSDTDT